MTNPPPKTGLWIKILLLASLGLNLAVIGVLVGLAGKPARPPRNIRAQDIVAALTFALPEEQRKLMRQTLIAHRRSFEAEHRSPIAVRREFVDALSSEPFDITAFDRILARERDQFISLGNVAYETLLGIVKNMTPEERQAFAQRLSAAAQR